MRHDWIPRHPMLKFPILLKIEIRFFEFEISDSAIKFNVEFSGIAGIIKLN